MGSVSLRVFAVRTNGNKVFGVIFEKSDWFSSGDSLEFVVENDSVVCDKDVIGRKVFKFCKDLSEEGVEMKGLGLLGFEVLL